MIMFPLFFLLMLITFVIGLSVLWIVALVDCLANEPSTGNEKLVWALVIVFTHFIGALLYFIVRRPVRMAQAGR